MNVVVLAAVGEHAGTALPLPVGLRGASGMMVVRFEAPGASFRNGGRTPE